jgi:tetratricopeptide (TPR) repeat protein
MSAPEEEKERFLPSVDRLEASVHAGRKALDGGRYDEALRAFNEALHLKPGYDVAWLLRGHALRRMGDFEGALQSFAQALRNNQDSEEGWMGLAAALHELRRYREEVEAYDELIKLHPRFVEAWINKGAALHDLKDYPAALGCYDRVLSLRPEHAAAWNNKGAALLRLGDEARAAGCFDQALHFNPDFLDAMVNRIFLSQRQGHHGEVVFWADRALRLREAGWLWYVKGLAHLGLLEATMASKAFERALSLDPSLRDAKAGLRRAKSLREKVDFYRGVYECFGMHLAGDPGCAACEIGAKCREVTR